MQDKIREGGGNIEVEQTLSRKAERTLRVPMRMPIRMPSIIRTTFSALRHRNYRLFFFGQLISLVGTWLQNTALAWLVYDLSHDSRMLGWISFTGSIPILFLSIYAGTVADEYPKRRLLVVTQTASGILALILATLIWTHSVSIPAIAVVSIMLGIITAFDLPTRQAFVVEMVGKEDISNAVALNSAVFNGARLVGPAIGAIIIQMFGIGAAFFLNGISYIAVIAGLIMMRFIVSDLDQRTKHAASASLRLSRTGAMMESVRYLNGVPQLRALMGLVIMMVLFGWSYAVNLPVVAAEVLHGGSTMYGALLSSNGVGALLAALTMAAWAPKLQPRKMLFSGIGVFVLSVTLLSFARVEWVAIAALVGCGWGIITFFITANTTLQRRVPDELRGRVMGIYSLSFGGIFPFGSLLGGYLAHHLGVSVAFRISAGMLTLVGLPTFIYMRKLPRLAGIPEVNYQRLPNPSEVAILDLHGAESEHITRV